MNLQIQPEIQVRHINFEFPQQIQRYWFGKSAFKTHLLNSLTILLPDIEQYLIHNVKHRIKQIDSSQLKQQAQAFIGQETQHSRQHSKFWDNLQFFNYKFDTYLHCLRAILFKTLESRLSVSFNLSISAGIEHLTTLIAEYALESDFMAEAEPHLKQIFEWHAVEEIEHKTVVYDVLQNTNKNYLIRILGLFISNILVLFFLIWGLVLLLYQDKKLLNRKVWQESIDFFLFKDKFFYRVLLNSRDYFRKGFHPSQKNNLFLI
jgi:predicted metal-dependent hydrolase